MTHRDNNCEGYVSSSFYSSIKTYTICEPQSFEQALRANIDINKSTSHIEEETLKEELLNAYAYTIKHADDTQSRRR